MPSRGGQAPSPLAGLPRPLDERDRPSRLGRRALSAGLLIGVAAVIAYSTLGSGGTGPFGGVGAVAGAIPSPSPIAADFAAAAVPSTDPGAGVAAAAASPPPTPMPTTTASPTPTPAPTAAPVETLTGYRWPLPHGRLTLPFGPTPWGSRIVDGELFHDGMDLATFCGDHVVAAHDGVVLAAGRHYDDLMGWVGDLQPYLDRLDKKKL